MNKQTSFIVSAIFSAIMIVPPVMAKQSQVTGGYFAQAFIRDGEVFASGSDKYFQVGPNANPATDGQEAGRQLKAVPVGIKNAKFVSSNLSANYAVLHDGRVVYWGMDYWTGVKSHPVFVNNLKNIIDVAGGSLGVLSYFVDDAGNLYNWDHSLDVDAQLDNSISNVKEVSTGRYHVMVLTNSGEVYVKGDIDVINGMYGQLGLGEGVTSAAEFTRVDLPQPVTAISAGDHHSVVLLEDGTVMNWGNADYGLMGNGIAPNIPAIGEELYTASDNLSGLKWTPVHVSILNDVVEIKAGKNHTSARKADGTMWTWGWSNAGALFTYAPIMLPGATEVEHLGSSDTSPRFMNAYGEVCGLGGNIRGQLGLGDIFERHTVECTIMETDFGGRELIYLNTDAPALNPMVNSVTPTAPYNISGTDFGDAQGTVLLNGDSVIVTSWSDTVITIDNPITPVSGSLIVYNADGIPSNGIQVSFESIASPATMVEEPARTAVCDDNDGNNGHGNNVGHFDCSNPGKGYGPVKGKGFYNKLSVVEAETQRIIRSEYIEKARTVITNREHTKGSQKSNAKGKRK